MNTFYSAERNIQILVRLLKDSGIKKIVISPGTTHDCFVGSLQYDGSFELYSALDERSAAYIACGLAAESGEPVVITCTGATASRNYVPGMTEAYYRKLPVIAVTSTQATEKIGTLTAQVIDRSKIQNDIAVISVLLPNVKDENDRWFCTLNANKALIALKRRGGGPVHINLETTYSRNFSIKELPPARKVEYFDMYSDISAIPKLDGKKVAIFVGSHRTFSESETAAIDKFCAAYDAAVFCDHTSGYKGKFRVQWQLVSANGNYVGAKNIHLDVLIHIGEISGDYAASGKIFGFADSVWRVNEDGELRDWGRKTSCLFEMKEALFFEKMALLSADVTKKQSFAKDLQNEYKAIYSKIHDIPFSNIYAAFKTAHRLPENSVLHLGILRSLMSWNLFETPRSITSVSNVGGFGIDGCVSTLVGASLADKNKLFYGVVGDLAFFYDLSVIGNYNIGPNVRIMIVNNGIGLEMKVPGHMANAFGGAEDNFICAAGHFGNKSRSFVKHIAEDLGFEYMCASDTESFDKSVARFVTPSMTEKPMIFELFTTVAEENDAIRVIHNLMPKQSPVQKPTPHLNNSIDKNVSAHIIEQLQNEVSALRFDIASVHNSVSFRIGRKITWFPRKVRGGICCLKEHGFAYTWKRFWEKVAGKLRR